MYYMKIFKQNLAIIILLILFFIFYTFLRTNYLGTQIPVSPDEAQALFFSKIFATNFSVIYHNPLNEIFNEKIFASRQFVQINDNTMPSAFLGYIIYLGIFRHINDSLIYISG